LLFFFSLFLKKKSFHFLFNFLLFSIDYYFLLFFFLLGGCGHPRDFFWTKIYHFSKRKKSPKQCFFFGEISPNFDLKNMFLSYTNEFPWPKFARFPKKVSKSSDFYDKFRCVALIFFSFNI
jgi:hypothetical protein